LVCRPAEPAAEGNRRFKCAACLHKFSVTSGTIFASRKLPIRDYLAAIAIFVNGASVQRSTFWMLRAQAFSGDSVFLPISSSRF